jgi:hypothetical protein
MVDAQSAYISTVLCGLSGVGHYHFSILEAHDWWAVPN